MYVCIYVCVSTCTHVFLDWHKKLCYSTGYVAFTPHFSNSFISLWESLSFKQKHYSSSGVVLLMIQVSRWHLCLSCSKASLQF